MGLNFSELEAATPKDHKVEDLALNFLHLFRPPAFTIERADLEDFRATMSAPHDQIVEAARHAIKSGWVADGPEGMKLTSLGEQIAQGV